MDVLHTISTTGNEASVFLRIVSKIILHLKALKNQLHECQSNPMDVQFAVNYNVTNQQGQCAYDVF